MTRFTQIVQIAVLAVVIWLAYSQWKTTGDMRELTSTMRTESNSTTDAITTRLRAIDSQLAVQSSAIQNALGSAIPLNLTESDEAELKAVETNLAMPSQWPQNTEAVARLGEQLAGVLNRLPPWGQDALLPRVMPRRWEIQALWFLRSADPADLDKLVAHQDSIESHLNAAPDGVSIDLQRQLGQRRDKIAKAVSDITLAEARAALKPPQDIDKAARLLGSYVGADSAEVKELRSQLSAASAQRARHASAASARAALDMIKGFTDSDFKESYAAVARQEIMELRLQMSRDAQPDAKLATLVAELDKESAAVLAALSKGRAEAHANKVRSYQVRVLEELKRVKPLAEYKKDKAGSGSKPPDPKAQLAEDMIKYMGSVDKSLLDVAVYQWFQTVYNQRFQELDEENRTKVIDGFARTPKLGIE